LTVGTPYLRVIQASSHIEAQEAQVRNAKALYDQAVDQFKAGTAPRLDVTRTEVHCTPRSTTSALLVTILQSQS